MVRLRVWEMEPSHLTRWIIWKPLSFIQGLGIESKKGLFPSLCFLRRFWGLCQAFQIVYLLTCKLGPDHKSSTVRALCMSEEICLTVTQFPSLTKVKQLYGVNWHQCTNLLHDNPAKLWSEIFCHSVDSWMFKHMVRESGCEKLF